MALRWGETLILAIVKTPRGQNMKRIAVYGKGGIGKSTLAANLSAALGLQGWRVLQVGCDPKQDSTRLLLNGKTITTVLDYLRQTPPEARSLDKVVHRGFAGVSCVEAGGPEPGVGCAGRGILTTFELLDQLGIERLNHDFVIYDVLGDVVCGGFAVPLRNEYAELVFIVTSGELMALYAGNNILRGIRNFEGCGPRLGGILFNERGLEKEVKRVESFAQAVKLPIVARFSRTDLFSEAERLGQTVIAAFSASDLAERFHDLAKYLTQEPPCFSACPLTLDQLERLVQGTYPANPIHLKTTESNRSTRINATEEAFVVQKNMEEGNRRPVSPVLSSFSLPNLPPRRYCSKSVRTQSVLFGCAFNGAAHTVMQVQDAATIVHGPRSCAYLSSLGAISAEHRLRNNYGLHIASYGVPDIHCSQMDEHTVIFGGNTALETTVQRVVKERPGPVFIVTTCSAGIIGDDARVAIRAATGGNGPARILFIPADGDITGDYMQGVLDAMRTIAHEWIDPNVTPEDDTVNIVAEKNLATNTEANFEIINGLLSALGIRVNCRFIRRCTTSQLEGFRRGRLNLLASDDTFGRLVCDFLTEHCRIPFCSSPFPIGFHSTSEWLCEVASIFGRINAAEEIISRNRDAYKATIAELHPKLCGKKIFIVAQNHRLDWILDTALDLDMEILKVGILESVWDDEFISRYEGRFPLVFPYPRDQREEDMQTLKPDITLINYPWRNMPDQFRFDQIPVSPDVGFFAGIAAARRWLRLMKLPAMEGWRRGM